MPTPSNEFIYVGLFYIGLNRFLERIRPILAEQIHDEAPAVLLCETSYNILYQEYHDLHQIFNHKGLVAHKVPQDLLDICEEVSTELTQTFQPFLESLFVDAQSDPWMEDLVGDEDPTPFAIKYQEHLRKTLQLIVTIREHLSKVRERVEIDDLVWNREWRPVRTAA